MKIKLSKRIFSIMMSIFMALSLLPAITLKVHASIKETGTGTKSDPYKIGNAENLFEFANIVNIIEREDHNQAACAILTQNIDLDEYSTTTWTPIGMSNKQPYTGTFDGKGFTISNLTIQNETGDYLGLFGCVMRGVIKNVGIKNANIKGKDCIGGVCGRNDGTIKNCSNAGNVSGKSRVGGVCGYNSGTIENCSNTGKVSGNGIVGGVCGGNYGTIKNCSNAGTVLGADSSTSWGVGGVCGDNYTGAIVNCSNAGDVSGKDRVGGVCGRNYTGAIVNCSNAGDVSGNNSVGGVCGYNYSGDSTKATIKNCSNTGNVSGYYSVGGVCGCNGIGSIENCSNTGKVSGNGSVGGVCGYNIDTIENCSNAGAVSGSENIGGVCGYNNSGASTKATIKNCYNIGDVSEGKNVGGVCGHNGTGTIENCYNTGDVSGSEKIGGVCGHNKGDSSKKATIENCYNIGDVSGTGSSFVVGGVCGYITGIGAITNCYYDKEVCSAVNAICSEGTSIDDSTVKGLTTEEMTGDASKMEGIAGNTGVWHFKDIKVESSEGGSSRDYLYYPHLKEFESTEKWPPKVRLNKVTFITTGESNKVNYLSSLSSLPESYKISDDVTDMDIEYYGKSITIDSEFFSGYTNLQRLSVSGNAIIAEKSLESTKINVVVLGKPGETSAITLQDNLGIKDAIFVLYGTASSIFKLGNNCTVVYDLTDGAKIENITGSCVVRSSKTDIFSEIEIPLKTNDSETTTEETTNTSASDNNSGTTAAGTANASTSGDNSGTTAAGTANASTSDDNSGTTSAGTATVFTPKLLTNFLSALFVGSVVTLDTTEGTYDLSGYENALSSTNGLVVLKGQETTDLPVILLDGTSKIYVNLNLQDQDTINFYTKEKYEKISCSFLDDKKVVDVVPESDKKTIFDVEYFQYRCPLNADQMSRIIKVSYSNDKGSYTRNCSVEAYIQRVIGLEASGNIEVKELLSLKNLVRATYLYGCAVRLCFEASHLDAFTFIISKIKEYIKPYMADFESECEKRAKAAEPKTEPESEGESQSQAAIGGIFKNSVSYTLLLQEKITLRVTFTGEEVDLSGVTLKVQYNGSDKGEVVVKDKNGKIEVNGFSPAALDKEVTLIATKSGLSEERISVSPLDYICSKYLEAKKDCNENLALLMQSMYYYYISAKAYETDEPSTN